MVRPWNRFLREVLDAPSLKAFNVRLGGSLSNPVYWKVYLIMAEDLEPDDFKVFSNPNHSLIFYSDGKDRSNDANRRTSSANLDTAWQWRKMWIKMLKIFLEGKKNTVLFIDLLLKCSSLWKSQHLKHGLQTRNKEKTFKTGQTAHRQWKDGDIFFPQYY